MYIIDKKIKKFKTIGSILLWVAYKLKGLVEDANFFTSYFEGDLDGYVTYKDLADVTGRRESQIKKQLHTLQKTCMKNYELKPISGVEQVVLNSKKYMCECKNCGAHIEKRAYFTGACSYCGSSDLFAKVMTNNRFYCIDNHVSKGIQKPSYYTAHNLQTKKILFTVLLFLGISVMAIMAMMGMDNIAKYNDQEYLRKVLLSGESYSSYDLIKKEIMDMILWSIVFVLALIPVVMNRGKRIFYINVADTYSKVFAKCKTPFLKAEFGGNHKIKAIRGALKRRYLRNCTLEKHGDVLVVALAKQIVKDQCTSTRRKGNG